MRRPPPRLQWYVIYYLLAAFDVLTVSALLYLNHRVVGIYSRSVEVNQRWARRAADYTDLGRLAAAANAPGNDVFGSRDVAQESARMERALLVFRQRVASLRSDLGSAVPATEGQPLLERLNDVEHAMEEMAADSRSLFAYYAKGQRELAGERMARMDRSYARLIEALRGLIARVALIQARLFDRQTASAVTLQRFERAGGGLILLMLAAAIGYGRQIAAHADQERNDRARYIGQLHEVQETLRRAHAEMERRVEERTRALRDSETALRRAAAEWQRTFEAIESPVLVLDLAGCALRLNRTAALLAGRSEAEARGAPIASLAGGEPWQGAAATARRVRESRTSHSTQVRDAGDGRTWEVSGSLVAAPGLPDERVIIVARDVTRLVELQESVRREERMSAMGSLVAGVAHEVRNPLFGISSTLDAFEARHGGSGEFDKYLKVLKGEVNRLRTLMQDLLDYGKPPVLDVTAVEFEEAVEEAVRACAPLAREARVRIAKQRWGLGRVPMDRWRMLQVFQNVIQNAVQHSPVDSAVLLEAGIDGGDGPRWAWLSVRDAGPGFRAEDLPRVFEPFFTRRQGGTGLGLSLAQRIVTQHGGVLLAANHPQGGALVSVKLPAGGARA